MADGVRLQKYLADCGVASRRKSEELILQGKVTVNGIVVNKLGTKVIQGKDTVRLEGIELKLQEEKVYILLNKPSGYVTTAKEQFGRPYIMDLLQGLKQRVFPVGRLDMDTSGLIILTNDGDFAYKLTHPKHHVSKKYLAEILGTPTEKEMDAFRRGLKIEDYITSPARIHVVSSKSNTCIVEITIYEGRNRQVKKMCEAIGHRVISLKRIAIGKLELKNLPEGRWKYLEPAELNLIFKD